MHQSSPHLRATCIAVLIGAALSGAAAAGNAAAPEPATAPAANGIEELVVHGDASLARLLGNAGSFDLLTAEDVDGIGATHIHETLSRVPGVWISRGSGQEHLTAIRSPIYTGAGACGEFLYLEDGIPIRPAGFCNINNLFELNFEQAAGIEVWRGPASAVLGGNALNGAINVLSPPMDRNRLVLEGGPYDFYRAGVELNGAAAQQQFGLAANTTHSNGWRDATGYEQHKVALAHRGRVADWEVRNTVSYTKLNQSTGAFVSGYRAYADSALRDTNPSPDSYRDAWSLRAASHWTAGPWRVVPYLRRSGMEFLQHFLPGEPVEVNRQTSGGVLIGHHWQRGDLDLNLGSQFEYMRGELREFQAGPLTDSTPFNNAVRPEGLHYDYDVDTWMAAGFYDLKWRFHERLALINSLRLEWLEYDYDNRMTAGNARDDGTPCDFGGCLYNRPGDRRDDFTNVAGRLGLERDFAAAGIAYVVAATGFRPPQSTELYRLQRGQDVADLDSQRLVSLEAGFRAPGWSVAAFHQRTRNFIFRDSAGLNVSDGRTRAHGIELAAYHTWNRHTLELSTTYAEHRYDFTGGVTGGEFVTSGNMVDTAPRWLTNARWSYRPAERWQTELELNIQGEHYINADNTAKYSGHEVLNWRGRYRASERVEIFARVINLLDARYADRADYTVFDPGNYRYFPAKPRQLYVGLTFDL